MNPGKKKILLFIVGGILVIVLLYFAFNAIKKYRDQVAAAENQARLEKESLEKQAANSKELGMSVEQANEFAKLSDKRIVSLFSISSIPNTGSVNWRTWLENNPHYYIENGKRRLIYIPPGTGKIDLSKDKSLTGSTALNILSKAVKLDEKQLLLIALGSPITLEELSQKQIK